MADLEELCWEVSRLRDQLVRTTRLTVDLAPVRVVWKVGVPVVEVERAALARRGPLTAPATGHLLRTEYV
jgi:hypothetical protein